MAFQVECFTSSAHFFLIEPSKSALAQLYPMTKRLDNGTPQGSVLSPILFSLMINDLPKRIPSRAALYTDDFCFWDFGSDITLLNRLCQRSLTNVCKWCEDNGFKLSSITSSAVLFTRKSNPEPISLCLQDSTRLQLKNEYKYLGSTFQRNGSYLTHIEEVVAKCRARLNVIRMLKGTSWVQVNDHYLLSIGRWLDL